MDSFHPRPPGFLRRFLIVMTFTLCGSALTGTEFERLLFLEGKWKMETRKGPLFEEWKKIDGNTLSGMSYRISGNDTLLLERIELLSRPEGIFYIPTVIHQNEGKPVSFKLVSSEDSRFVFENMEHDFPQRIIYSVVAADSMVARIEGISGGKAASSDFYYRRMAGK